jgi:hypothetical protein
MTCGQVANVQMEGEEGKDKGKKNFSYQFHASRNHHIIMRMILIKNES